MSKILLYILAVLAAFAYALPESPHPYPANCDDTKIYYSRGAVALEVKFTAETSTEAGNDFIIVSDSQNRTVGEYSGDSLRGQTLLVEGDCVYIRLVSDGQNQGYGYAVADIRAIFSAEYFSPSRADYSKADGLYNRDLKEELYNLVKDHVCLGYTGIRQKMFGEIDNESGKVRCVYTARWVQTSGIPDPNDMNTEHTWPKSMGASEDPAKSDLCHLFPTDSYANSKRGNYPFGVVTVVHWSKEGSSLGENENGSIVFTPRADHRGNVARAIFYFSIRYRLAVPDEEESVLKRWNSDDPVDAKERARNDGIAKYQKKRNPFIDHPEYVDRIEDF